MGTNSKTTSVTDLDTESTADAAVQASKAAVEAKAEKTLAPTIGVIHAKERKYVISIASTETDSTPVKVGVNGEMTLIPRNTQVTIGQGIKSVLDDAVVEVITQEGGKTVTMNAPRFPVSVHNIIEAGAE